jgi:prevent-host-death family protein
MESKKDIRPVTYLKAHAADLLAQVNETHRPVFITQKGEARAVLQDPESYERMRSALGLMKLLAQGEEDVRQGRVRSQEEVFAGLADSLAARTDKKGG